MVRASGNAARIAGSAWAFGCAPAAAPPVALRAGPRGAAHRNASEGHYGKGHGSKPGHQHGHSGCFAHRRATRAPAWTSNSRVALSVWGGPGTVSGPRTAAITRFTWPSAKAAVASRVARSATPTVSRSCAEMAGHAASRSRRCRSAHPRQLVQSKGELPCQRGSSGRTGCAVRTDQRGQDRRGDRRQPSAPRHA